MSMLDRSLHGSTVTCTEEAHADDNDHNAEIFRMIAPVFRGLASEPVLPPCHFQEHVLQGRNYVTAVQPAISSLAWCSCLAHPKVFGITSISSSFDFGGKRPDRQSHGDG